MDWYFLRSKFCYAFFAGFFSAAGILFFNSMLAKASPQEVGMLFLLMCVAQAAVPVIYTIIMNGGLTLIKGIKLAVALLAIVLLST